MFCSILTLVMVAAAAVEDADSRFPVSTGDAATAAGLLEQARDADADGMKSKVDEAIKLLDANSPAGAKLAKAREAGELPAAIKEVAEMLAFQPLREADLPKGFPTYTPVGSIEVKRYPESRRAEADEFFTLFRHITANNIAMTAPVRMEMSEGGDGKLKQESMAFYYGSSDVGEAGADGDVRTIDDKGELVVAIGCRGDMGKKAIAAAHDHLKQWLEESDYEATGKVIVMGYNSPMIPKNASFFEVQLPVKKKAESDADEAS